MAFVVGVPGFSGREVEQEHSDHVSVLVGDNQELPGAVELVVPGWLALCVEETGIGQRAPLLCWPCSPCRLYTPASCGIS